MIEESLLTHLRGQPRLADCLTKYDEEPAIFSQEAPADTDEAWAPGPQYGRLVFTVDLQGDPERTMGGTLVVDIMCHDDEECEFFPEDIEPIVRELIHGYFFSSGTFTVAAQWKNSSYFTHPTDPIIGCTVSFDLLAFPVLTTYNPDVVERLNEWTAQFDRLHVINMQGPPLEAWKPQFGESAVYWRLVTEAPAGWIPDTYQTIWRTATVRGHIFSEDLAEATSVGRKLITRLYASRRLRKPDEAPIIVNQKNTLDSGADPLRTGQVTVEATYGVIVCIPDDPPPVYREPPQPPIEAPPVYREPAVDEEYLQNINYPDDYDRKES